MFDRMGKDALGRLVTGSRARSKAGRRLQVESLEGRAMMTASISPIANISVPQYQGYQVPLTGGTTHAQTFTVTSDNPGIKASIAKGQFWTITVSHAAADSNDIAVNGSMTFQLFEDLTPNTAAKIESLITGTATGLASGVTISNDNYYAGKVIHRIASGFPDANSYIVQGGSLDGDGTGTVFATPFADEFNQQLAFTGTGQLAMANSGPDTNDSQFFITTGSPTFLNYHHTIFGQLVDGQDILTQLTQVEKGTDGTTPKSAVTISADSLSSTSPDGVIHIDTSVAAPNSTANITVTATDAVDQTTASQTFQVTATPFDTTNPDRPFIANYDPAISIGENQTLTFQLNAVATPPSDSLTYTVQGGVTTSSSGTTSFSSVTNGSATVSSTGLVSFTPTTGYTGTVTLLVGVRDQVNRGSSGDALDSPDNYEYHTITVTVGTSTTAVAVRPLSQTALITATTGTATPIQLFSSNPNNTETTALTYTLNNQPTHGTITGFNATTGKLSYTPTAGYIGPDAFSYTVNDPTSGLSSFPTTINLNVGQASTGAVRFFADDLSTSTTTPGVLVVTPLPRTDHGTNTVDVDEVDGNVQVTVNGVIDNLQPSIANVDSITVYGSKANDVVNIDPNLSVPVLLSGGGNGTDRLQAGGGPTTELGWHGKVTEVQGSSNNYLYGKTGRVTFVKGTGNSNVIFEGNPGHFVGSSNVKHLPTNPTGTFYKFEGGKLVKSYNPFKAQNVGVGASNLTIGTDSVKAKATVAHPKSVKVTTAKQK